MSGTPSERARGGARRESGGGTSSDTSYSVTLFGYVVALREDYGFIQPLLSKEHVYFDKKECVTDVVLGDDVSFVQKTGKRGTFACQVNKIDLSRVVVVPGAVGVVLRDCDAHKHSPGLLDISAAHESLQIPPTVPIHIPFKQNFSTSKRHVRYSKGEELSFELSYIPSTSFCMASNLSIIGVAKEKRYQQAQDMASSGAVVERGIVDSVLSDYGFVAPVNSPEHIYFKLSDVLEYDHPSSLSSSSSSLLLRKGCEVEFIVITESIKGKLCERAVHLRLLPKGSVAFEQTLAAAVPATVTLSPVSSPHEAPGLCVLAAALPPSLLPTIHLPVLQVQLWGRCLPDFMHLRPGDAITIDVVYYSREKLVFARAVKLTSYALLGREIGTVIRARESDGFAFIRSDMRETDVYFRLKDVTISSSSGCIEAAPIDAIVNGAAASYTLVIDDTNISACKLKCIRVHLLGDSAETDGRRVLLSKLVECVVVREASKDRPGQLQAIPSQSAAIDITTEYSQKILFKQEFDGLNIFLADPSLTELVIDNLMTCQRRVLLDLLDKHFKGISCELVDVTAAQANFGGGLRSLRLTKRGAINEGAVASAKKEPEAEDGKDTVHFHLADSNDSYGALLKDHRVICSVYFDKKTGKRFARDVAVKEESSADSSTVAYGVIQVVKSKNGVRYGMIRVFPSCEKLFWHSSCVSGSSSEIAEGTEVSFFIKLRGGLRCASGIAAVTNGFLSRVSEAEGQVRVLVVEGSRGVVVEALDCAMMQGVYSNLLEAVKQLCDGGIDGGNKNWERAGDVGEASGGGPVELGGEGEEVKFFTPCERHPVSLDADAAAKAVPVGSIVLCRATFKWTASISPTTLRVISRTTESATRYRGIVNRVKLKGSGGGGAFMEIKKDAIVGDGSGLVVIDDTQPVFYYAEEIVAKREKPFFVGDIVEFFGLPGSSVGMHVSAHRSVGAKDESIFFKRTPINAELKNVSANKGVAISMAGGPPDDSAVGFNKGWRGRSDIEGLSWSHLLQHLL